MKNFKLILFSLSIIGLIITSCDPSVEAPGSNDESTITFLPLITLTGGDIVLDCNTSSYSDPGAVASAGGVEIDLITKVSSLYFGGTEIEGPDFYSVSYSAFNTDGVAASGFRSVSWPPCNGDLVTSIAGTYTASSLNRSPGYSTSDIGPIIIKDLGNGVYAISDAIGGWYEHEYGYGPDYAAIGMTVTANDIATNDFTYNDEIPLGAWGLTYGPVKITSFSVDPVSKTIEFTSTWAVLGYTWTVTLTQVD